MTASFSPRLRWRATITALATAVVYVVAARLGLRLAYVGDNVSVLWPAAAIGLCASFWLGTPARIGVFVGAALATALSGAPWIAAIGVGLGNAAEAHLAALLLQRREFDANLRRMRDVALLCTLATIVPCAVAASIGVASLAVGSVLPWSSAPSAWLVWWVGDAMGIIVLAPVVFSAAALRDWRRLTRGRALELASVATLLVIVAYSTASAAYPTTWAVFPVLTWAAARFGPFGGASASLVVSAACVWCTLNGQGEFARWDLHTNLALLQLFLAVVTFTTTFLAAAVAQFAAGEAERARLKEVERVTREREMLREQLIGVLGHDLRNPLSTISAGLTVLAHAEDAAQRDRVLQRLQTTASRMARLIADVLDFTRVQFGVGIPLACAPVDLADVCGRVLAEFETAHPKRVFHAELVRGLVGRWDADRLAQVVSNLVGNAVQHSTSDVSVALRASGDQALLRVANSGEPIPESIRQALFHPFKRGRDGGQGLGLGLFIVERIVSAHGGVVTIESDADRGTVFSIALPLADRPRTEAPAPIPAVAASPTARL